MQELAAYLVQAQALVRRASPASTGASDDELAIRGTRAEARVEELKALQQLFADAEEDYKSLCAYFHEGSSRAARQSDEFFGLWDGFLEAVRVAVDSTGGRARRQKARLSLAARPTAALRQRALDTDDTSSEGTPKQEQNNQDLTLPTETMTKVFSLSHAATTAF